MSGARAEASRRTRSVDVALWVIAALLVLSEWGPRLARSLWVDEANTFFMTHSGIAAAIRITAHWPGQSILYSILESFFTFPNSHFRDFFLRLPSMAASLVTAYFLYRLAERGFGKNAGFAAALLFLLHPNVLGLSTQARSYPLGLAAVAGSSLYLYQWVEDRRRGDLWAYVVASTLVIYFHYMFGMIFVCHAVYLAYVFGIERRWSGWGQLLLGYVGIGVLCLPLAAHMRLLLHEAHTLPYVPAPDALELSEALLPATIAFGLFAAAILTQFIFRGSLRKPVALSRSLTVLLLSWWLITPIFFFAASISTPMRVFLPRYIASAIPGQTLLLAYAGYTVFEGLSARVWILCAVFLSTASPLAFLSARKTAGEELKPFMNVIQDESRTGTPPVFFSSSLVESDYYDWKAGLNNGSYLFAPFVAYPMKNQLLPLPYTLNRDEIKQYVSDIIDTQLRGEKEVLFASKAFPGEGAWNSWLIARMKQAGFNAEIEAPNNYYVIIFKRAGD
jgi:hypothetical protein